MVLTTFPPHLDKNTDLDIKIHKCRQSNKYFINLKRGLHFSNIFRFYKCSC